MQSKPIGQLIKSPCSTYIFKVHLHIEVFCSQKLSDFDIQCIFDEVTIAD